jgi:hypothetical protein
MQWFDLIDFLCFASIEWMLSIKHVVRVAGILSGYCLASRHSDAVVTRGSNLDERGRRW